MFYFKSSQISLFATTAMFSSIFIANSPVLAATFSFSEAILDINNFSISPQNPFTDSNTKAVAFSGDTEAISNANAEGSLISDADSDLAAINTNFYSSAFGEGNNFFGFGESSSLVIGSLTIDPNQILSFDFELSLDTFNQVDTLLDGSIATLSEVNFLLFDNNTNSLLGDFTATTNINTNLVEDINNDFISVEASRNVAFNGDIFEDFEGNIESAELSLTGSFAQFFNSAIQVRLEVATLTRSCVQAPLTNDPCTKVPEPDNTMTLFLGFLGLGLISRFRK